jgi:hypothetical protein
MAGVKETAQVQVIDNYQGELFAEGDQYNDIQISLDSQTQTLNFAHNEEAARKLASEGSPSRRSFPSVKEARQLLMPGEQLVVKRDSEGSILEMAIRQTVAPQTKKASCWGVAAILSGAGAPILYAAVEFLKGLGAIASGVGGLLIVPTGLIEGQTPQA